MLVCTGKGCVLVVSRLLPEPTALALHCCEDKVLERGGTRLRMRTAQFSRVVHGRVDFILRIVFFCTGELLEHDAR
jgi:hypothetical protein